MDGIGSMWKNDFDTAERGVSRALNVPDLAWVRDELLLCRAMVRYYRMKFTEGLRDVERVGEDLERVRKALEEKKKR